MSSVVDVTLLAEVFITLFVIMDPPGAIPLFLALTRNFPPKTRNRAAWQACSVAFCVIVAFALFGRQVLSYLHISLPALQCAGGLLLLLVALELLTGRDQHETATQTSMSHWCPWARRCWLVRARLSPPWCSPSRLTRHPISSPWLWV